MPERTRLSQLQTHFVDTKAAPSRSGHRFATCSEESAIVRTTLDALFWPADSSRRGILRDDLLSCGGRASVQRRPSHDFGVNERLG